MNKHHIGWVIVIIGLLVIASGLPSVIQTLDYLNKSKYTSGVVVTNAERDFHNAHFYIPIVEFKTAEGETRQFKSITEYSPQKYFNGDQVEVIYDPSNPAKADINSSFEIWSESLATIVIGLFFVLIGVFAKDKKRAK